MKLLRNAERAGSSEKTRWPSGGAVTHSQKRVADSEDFQKVLRNIARYQERKKRKKVSLNEVKFLADREDDDDDDEDDDADKKDPDDADDPVFKRDFYGEEALNITIDYVRALSKQKVARAG